MNAQRRLYLAVVGWLAIVAVGSTLVWTVVAHAGRDVGDPDRDTLAASSGTEPTGSAQPSASVSPTGTAGTPGADPSSSPTQSVDPGEDDDPTPSSSPSSSPSTPPAQSHRRTWQGTAGTVVATCTGAKISGRAQPNSGWRVEVENPGPRELSVKFELTEDEEDDRIAARSAAGEVFEEVEVQAHCSSGVPSFSAD